MTRPYRVEVAVPMRDRHGLTRDLARQLAEDPDAYDRFRIYDNGSETPAAVEWLATIDRTGRYGAEVVPWGPRRGIYAMWNDAILRAFLAWRQTGVPTFVAILNNDLTIPPGFLRHLADALAEARWHAATSNVWITYPEWKLGWPAEVDVTGELIPTTGTRNRGGMSGYAFMLDVQALEEIRLPLIDEGYLWHSGDGDLVLRLQDAGGTAAAVKGLPVGHVENATSADHSWTAEQGAKDRARARRLETARRSAR